MRVQIAAGIRALVVLTVLTGLVFPLAMTGIVQVAFDHEANGSLVERDGRIVGSELLGQAFSGPRYFHPRPSAAAAGASGSTVEEVDSDGEPTGQVAPADPQDLALAVSGASNLGPTNDALLDAIAERVTAYRAANGLDRETPVPVDAVTASASGLDPHISVANARLQASRVAAARGMTVDDVLDIVREHTTERVLGVLGERGVNVLALNLAIDEHQGRR